MGILFRAFAVSAVTTTLISAASFASDLCVGYGPQTPRDISSEAGANPIGFIEAPPAGEMNLCNIHTHTNAEHKGPDFRMSAGNGKHGGFKCNASNALSDAELQMPEGGSKFEGVKPGDTIEVHWVHTTCDVKPGPGLAACSSAACANPQLRVEAQVFLVVNDSSALDFETFAYKGNLVGNKHQALSLPGGTGAPVVFAGSTTGPKYNQSTCSPLQVTWSVRPSCAKVDINSLNRWAKSNVFKENSSHGVRALVTAPELLSPIQ